jgi:hypothetical protein
MTTRAEEDYRRGFHDGESGRAEVSGSESYRGGYRVGALFARDAHQAAEPSAGETRAVDVADVLAEIPRRLRKP